MKAFLLMLLAPSLAIAQSATPFPPIPPGTSKEAMREIMRDRMKQMQMSAALADQAKRIQEGEAAAAEYAKARAAQEAADLANGWARTRDGYFVSTSYPSAKRAGSYMADGDKAALEKLVAAGEVFPMKAGVKVRVVDTLLGVATIRREGETNELFTQCAAVGR